jgi:hypothetical protein
MGTKVFLGPVYNGSMWRFDFIKLLKIDYFDPTNQWVMKKTEEIKAGKEECNFYMYVITPKMFSSLQNIAQVVDDSNKFPWRTILIIQDEDGGFTFTKEMLIALEQIVEIVRENGAHVFESLEDAATFLNVFATETE